MWLIFIKHVHHLANIRDQQSFFSSFSHGHQLPTKKIHSAMWLLCISHGHLFRDITSQNICHIYSKKKRHTMWPAESHWLQLVSEQATLGIYATTIVSRQCNTKGLQKLKPSCDVVLALDKWICSINFVVHKQYPMKTMLNTKCLQWLT